MEKLRQKKINDFISTLNEREQRYMIKKINELIFARECEQISFTLVINGKKEHIA